MEAWEWRNPLDVCERRELQANAAAKREQAKKIEEQAKRAEQQRIRGLVFRKGPT